MAPRDVLTIYPGRDGTLLVHHAGPGAAAVRRLFGTATLPAPWRGAYNLEQASRDLQARNPEATVLVSLVAPPDDA